MVLNIRDIKRRQKSVKNIGQMARAMELVSVTKMRRSQRVALASRPYAKAAFEILKNISVKTDASKSYFFGNFGGATSEKERIIILLITTDKGLCAGLNANVFRRAEKLISDLNFGGATSIGDRTFNRPEPTADFIVIGKKGEEWCRRKKLNVVKQFSNFGDYVAVSETAPVSEFLISAFKQEKYSQIFAVYSNFITALKQEAVSRQILPLDKMILKEIIGGITPQAGKFSEIKDFDNDVLYDFEYKFEPRVEEILDDVLYSLVETEIYYIILENNASEHSARRAAMRSAYENADEMARDLNLTYNKARQAGITRELAEIASAADI